jgi:hypothetical protein
VPERLEKRDRDCKREHPGKHRRLVGYCRERKKHASNGAHWRHLVGHCACKRGKRERHFQGVEGKGDYQEKRAERD